MSKAFDKVDHIKIGNVLLKRGLPPDTVLLFINYICNQYGRILWQGEKREYRKIGNGVRQGGILSPMFFILYIDDILKDEVEEGCRLGPHRLYILAYTDNVAIPVNNVNRLVELCNVFQEKIVDLKLTVNQNKTKCIIFCSHKRKRPRFIGKYEVVDSYKYLGHLIHQSLHDDNHGELRVNSYYASFD